MVMAVVNEKKEGSVSSLIVESLESNSREDFLSPEDLAWVDSCLIKDPEIPESKWNDLKDALLEIINFLPEARTYSSSGNDGLSEATDIEMHLPSEEAETSQSGKIDDDVHPIIVESETKNNSYPINPKTGTPLSKFSEGDDAIETFMGNPFQPTYKEGRKVSEAIDLDSVAVEVEPLSKDIFKVWDLGVPDEEDELITQLNKALAETPPESIPSAIDDSGTWKDLKDESIDNLIAGLANLSLDQNSL